MAISNANGNSYFSIQNNNANSHLTDVSINHAINDENQSIKVKTIKLDYYCSQTNIVPNVIKIDVEGAEIMVLEGAEKLLNECNAVWIISTHSSELFDECKNLMMEYGYVVKTLEGFHHEIFCEKN